MAKLQIVRAASNSPIIRVFIQDSSKTDGSGLTGRAFGDTGLNISVIRELDATATTYTSAGSTTETITTLGTYAAPTATKCRFKEVDATNLPGMYELQFAQALFGTGDASRFITGMITGVTNMAPCLFEVQLVALDPQTSPVAANVTQLLGTAWLTPGTAGTPDVNTKLLGGTAQTGRDIGASVLISSGTGTGQLDVTSGAIKVQSNIKKNVALSNFEFLMVSSADHLTPLTGLTVSGQISKDGGAFGACANAVAEVANGIYKINLAQAEMNANIITLYFTAATADGQFITIITQP